MTATKTAELVESTGRPTGGTETVLIVDDESSILKIARRMLEKLGYTVLTAPGLSEAPKRLPATPTPSTRCSPTWSCRR